MQSGQAYAFDAQEILTRFVKYSLEGLVVALAAFTIPQKGQLSLEDTVVIALVAMCTFSVLDYFAPSMSSAARMGAGAGIGANLVGFPGGGQQQRM